MPKGILAFSLWFCAWLLLPKALGAQTSIIEDIQNIQGSIVSIKAENFKFFKSGEDSAAFDRKTGRLAILRNLARAAYERYGAGVVLHPSGIIVTNAHNVGKADHITVIFPDGNEFSGEVIRFVNDLDLAFIKVSSPQELIPIAMADSDAIKLGDEIITVGNSEFLKQTISGGKIIGLGVSHTLKEEGKNRTDLIQTTVNLYEGDSGGPLFDRQGKLIGLMTAKETSADHSSFAVPSNKIASYLEECLDSRP